MSDYNPDPSKPIQGPFYDEKGRMYYVRQNGDKSYVSPAAQGPGHNVPGDDGGVFHHRSEWNQDTGEYEKNLDWGHILSMVVAGTLTVGAATAMMGGSAAAEEMATATATAGSAPPAAEVAAAEAAAAGPATGGPSIAGLVGEGGTGVSTAKTVSNLLGDDAESEFDGVDMGEGSDTGDTGDTGDSGSDSSSDSSSSDSSSSNSGLTSALKKLGLSSKDIAKLIAGGGLGALAGLLGPKKHSMWGEHDSTGQSVDPRDILGEGLSKNRSTFDALSQQIGEGVTLPSSFVQQPGTSSGGGHSFGLSGLDPALSDPGLLHLKGLDVSGKGLPPQITPSMPAGAPGGFNGLPGGNAGPTLRDPSAAPSPAPGANLRPLPGSGPRIMPLNGGQPNDMDQAKAAFKMIGVKV